MRPSLPRAVRPSSHAAGPRPVRAALSVLTSLALSGCGAVTTVKQIVVAPPSLGTPLSPTDFLGGIAADEPQAVLVGKQILARGGSAADAAAAMGFALAVTLPSRAGLGAGGACIAYAPGAQSVNQGVPEAIVFIAPTPALAGGSRPAAAPMLPRGLLALQARYGVLPVQQVIAPAEQLARLGAQVSRPLADDLAVVGGALLADPGAAHLFAAGGAALAEHDTLVQPDLGSSLARLRVQGVGDLYQGMLAQAVVSGSAGIGGRITAADLRAAVPRLAVPLMLDAGTDRAAFLPPPADGGLAAAAAFQRLQTHPTELDEAQARALGAASAWRQGGQPDAILNSTATPEDRIAALPASTAFVTLDRTGAAVACAISMGNLFGTGRVLPGTGMLLAASPAAVPAPLLAAAIAWNPRLHAFRAEVAGSGQAMAALGVAAGLRATLAGASAMPSTVPEPGRINAIACPKYLPGRAAQCSWATDPRGAGLALGTD